MHKSASTFILIILTLIIIHPYTISLSTLSLEKNNDIMLIKENNTLNQLTIGNGVLFQAFYWDVPEGNWYNTIASKIPELKNIGVDSIWLPPPYKGASGGYSMGYDPYDYYDLGEYNQKGITRTRFGTKQELLSLINLAHKYQISVIADIVINHNSGGNSEWNPYTNSYTYTDFTHVSSGRFPRNYTAFHPCAYEQSDEGAWGGFPDLCHANPYVHDQLIEWGKWLKNEIGFDAWRFDYAKGYHPSMVKDWMNKVGGWGVAEYWDGNIDHVRNYLDSIENKASVFDFPLFYTLKDMTDNAGYYDMRTLANPYSITKERPFNSVTFVENHDTNHDGNGITKNKQLAYAYILTHEGYPSIFWKDLFDPILSPKIKNLILIHNQFASGSTIVRYTDQDLYIAERMGDPGLLILLNDGDKWNGATVQTKWKNMVIHDLTGQAEDEYVDENGNVEVWAPPKGYTVFAPGELKTTTFTPTTKSTSSNQTSQTTNNTTSTTQPPETTNQTPSLLYPTTIIMLSVIATIKRKHNK